MKYIILLTVLFALFLFSADIEISLKPFNIKLHNWHFAVSWVLIVVALLVAMVGEHNKGYKQGLNDGTKMVKEMWEDILEEQHESNE